jgi:hypothetical protein
MRQQRVFRDCTGVNWRVSEVLEEGVDSLAPRDRRSTPRLGKRVAQAIGLLHTRALNLGYLAFDSPVERRFVQPIPDAWHGMTNQELEDLLDSARPRVAEPLGVMAEDSRMARLSDFIRANTEQILGEWENVARALATAEGMDIAARRDHAKEMLSAIALDLDIAPDSDEEISARGRSDVAPQRASPDDQTHGTAVAVSGIVVEEIVSEFRALRASVHNLWSVQQRRATAVDLHAMTRFNAAIDQAMAESISTYVHGR